MTNEPWTPGPMHIIGFVILLIASSAVAAMLCEGEKQRRSQVVVTTDPETGCQYVSKRGAFAGISPRLDKSGKPICEP